MSYADAMVGNIIYQLDELNLRENTIIVLWGDHGWHLGEHMAFGENTLCSKSLCDAPLIICHPGLPAPGKKTDSMVETIDLFPTLCDLAGLAKPKTLHGVSLEPILQSVDAPGHDAIAYENDSQTLPTSTHPHGVSPFSITQDRRNGALHQRCDQRERLK